MTINGAYTGARVWNSDLGEFINEDHRRFAEILRDLKPTYSLEYIPVSARETAEDREKPWRIIDSPDGLQRYVVRYMSEAEMLNPTAILSWLLAGDIVRHGAENVLRRIESEENARKLMELKRQEDELEDRIEYASFLVSGGRDKKHTINLGEGRKLER